jgi:hydroxymethylbilane synthase
MPAPGQGALALECRAVDAGLATALAALDHPPTRLAVAAERALLARLGAGCAAPVGAYGRPEGGLLTLDAIVVADDGAPVRGSRTGPAATPADAERLGRDLADELLGALATSAPTTARPTTARRPDA